MKLALSLLILAILIAQKVYITFTDLAGHVIDLTADYSFDTQLNNEPNSLSFNAYRYV